MRYDHTIRADRELHDECFHLSCGFYDTTYFFFARLNLSVSIHCKGTFTFRTADGQVLHTHKAAPMTDGRGCYMDVLITTTENGAIFRLPEYIWYDNYPCCDGESDRWDTKIIGIREEIVYPAGA